MLADLTALVADVGRASVAGLWLPLIGWTLIAGCALLADRWLTLLRPRVRATLLTAVLVALPLGLAVRALPSPMPNSAARTVPTLFVLPPTLGAAPLVAPVQADALPAPAPPLWPLVSGSMSLLALVLAIGGLGYVALSASKLARWSRALTDVPGAGADATRQARALGVRSTARVRVVSQDVTPCTYGVVRTTIVLPASLGASARMLALRHEVAHVRHGDASAHLLALVCSSLIAWHPLAHALRRRATLRREQAADAFALAEQPDQRGTYARLLTHFSAAPTLAPALAVPRHHLHNRLTAMTRSIRFTSPGRALPLAALLILTALIALPLRAQETPTSPDEPEQFTVVERSPELLPNERDALRAMQERITFPPEAIGVVQEARAEIRFTVTETGSVANPMPVSLVMDPEGDSWDPRDEPLESPYSQCAHSRSGVCHSDALVPAGRAARRA